MAITSSYVALSFQRRMTEPEGKSVTSWPPLVWVGSGIESTHEFVEFFIAIRVGVLAVGGNRDEDDSKSAIDAAF
jgi:NO-binding membrane sensor protein with MHYT domain